MITRSIHSLAAFIAAFCLIGCSPHPAIRDIPLPFVEVLAISDMPHGQIAFGGYGGLVIYDKDHYSAYTGPRLDRTMQPFEGASSVLPSDLVITLLRTSDDKLWVGCARGLVVYHDGTFTDVTNRLPPTWPRASPQGLPDDGVPATEHEIFSLFECKNGQILIGTRNAGLFIYDRHTDQYRLLFCEHGANKWIGAIAEDSSGNLWLGVFGIGMMKGIWQGERLALQTIAQSATKNVRSMCVDRNDYVWIGTHTGLFRLSRSGMLCQWNAQGELPDDNIWQVYEDSKGELWIITSNGVSTFKGNRWRNVKIEGLRSGPMSVICETHHGYWICTSNGVRLYQTVPLSETKH